VIQASKVVGLNPPQGKAHELEYFTNRRQERPAEAELALPQERTQSIRFVGMMPECCQKAKQSHPEPHSWESPGAE